MTTEQAREVFNQIVRQHIAAGRYDQAANIEIAREYFTNPKFRKAIENMTYEINR